MNPFLRTSLKLLLLTMLFVGILNINPILTYAPQEITVTAKDLTEDAPREDTEKTVIEEVYDDTPLETTSKAEKSLKTAYLTFDDGPSLDVTPQILDILKEHNIKATFFIIGSQAEANPELILRIKDEGHMISNHTYSHDYSYLYANPRNFLDDIKKTEESLKSILGNAFNPSLLRFPGGSHGKGKAHIREAVVKEGYNYIDWNVVSGDAEAVHVSPARQMARIKETLRNQEEAIVLMHDASGKQTTAQVLADIIKYIDSQGYDFKTLDDYEF